MSFAALKFLFVSLKYLLAVSEVKNPSVPIAGWF